MSRKPHFIAARDRGAVEVNIDDSVPEGGAWVDLDGDDPNNLIIDEIDDTPEGDRGRPQVVTDPLEVSEDELRGLSSRTQDRIKRLTFERETERRGREQAERDRDAATDHSRRAISENERLRTSVAATTSVLATSMIKERETAMATARQKLAAAHAESDSEAIAEATTEISIIASELAMVKAQRPKEPDPAAVAAAAAADPKAATRETPTPAPVHPDVVEWISRNNWFSQRGGEEKTAIAMATHRKLIDNNIRPGDPAYIKGLDEGLKKLFPDHRARAEVEAERSGETQRRGDVVNGGSRQTTTPNANPRRVSLTASEINLARNLGITPQAYAASKVKHEASNKGSAR